MTAKPHARAAGSAARAMGSLVAVLAVGGALAAVGCSPSPPATLAARWTRPAGGAFSGADVTAALPGTGGDPWLVGGFSGGGVAIWWAATAAGPWQRATFSAVTNDGPMDTIIGLARAGAVTAALGSHASPIHGIARPSPWTSADGGRSWSEVPTLRELFGGENIVGLGTMTGGPHGLSVAGTWVSAENRSVATVWQSADGRRWVRNDHDPSLAGSPGELTMAAAVGDRADGLVMVGSAHIPTPATPAAQRGALWQSADGATWSRVDGGDRSLDAGQGQVAVERVAPAAGGWVAAGVRSVGGRSQVVVWTWRPGHPLAATSLAMITPAAGAAVGGLALTPSAVVVAASAGGAPRLWVASVGTTGQIGRWRPISPPPGPPPGLRSVALAFDGTTAVLVLRGATGSQVWHAALA